MASETTLQAIVDHVADTIATVTGIGKVHNYLRWAMVEADVNAMAVTGGVINVWQVTRLNTQERWMTTGDTWRVHTLAIYGTYGLADADETERTFQALIERVATKFRTMVQYTFGDTVESISPSFGPMASGSALLGAICGVQVESVEHRTWNTKLVHWGELRLGVQELPTRVPE